MPCGCGESRSGFGEHKRAFAERALKLAMSLPDDVTARKNFSAPQAQFLSALRDLASGYSMAHSWTEEEAKVRLDGLKFADAAMDYAFSVAEMPVGGGGSGESCTARCNREKEQCRNRCDQEDAGYFCYFDCRLTYMACLASCIGGGSGFGDGGPVIA